VGDAKYKAKQYAEAIAAYTKALEKTGTDELKEKANYMLGYANHHLDQHEAALAAFSQQVASFPQGKLYPDGLFMKGECLFKLERYEEALPTYVKCQGQSGYSDEKTVLILLHAGQSASQTDNWQQALELLQKIPEAYPDSEFVPQALYEQAWAKQNLNETDAAKQLYAATAEKESREEVGARARFMLGELYFNEKDYKQAIAEFQRVVFGFGGDQASAGVKKWQAKSAYEIARCNDVQIRGAKTPQQRQQFVAQAKRFYKLVVEKFPDSEVAKLAAQRVAAL
jgi:outer membrane protein assembly factor BamD (BamD/ComL family)